MMSLGPIMIDLEGTALTPEERELLAHPLVGGVILFSRNYETPAQLATLVADVHALRSPRLLVAVDHEGGRVQRFRDDFSVLPAAGHFGEVWSQDPARAEWLAETCGWVLAAELRAADVDFSFAPVLDLARGRSTVIGDRAFHRSPQVVAELARAFTRGLHRAGMAAVGKHFPGHGTVEADSHLVLPEDPRPLETIRLEDMLAFERMIHYGLPAIMPAHVRYPAVDDKPAGFSRVWLQDVLRASLGFQGAVFSDDLSMEGAAVAGDIVARAETALAAGCDMALACNDRAGVVAILDRLRHPSDPVAISRLARMHGHGGRQRDELAADPAYRQAVAIIATLEPEPELHLRDDNVA